MQAIIPAMEVLRQYCSEGRSPWEILTGSGGDGEDGENGDKPAGEGGAAADARAAAERLWGSQTESWRRRAFF